MWVVRAGAAVGGNDSGAKTRAGRLGHRSHVPLGGCIAVVGALEGGEMVGIWIQSEDQANEICCWVHVEEGKRKELKTTPGFSLLIWKDKANERGWRAKGSWFWDLYVLLCPRCLRDPYLETREDSGAVGLEKGRDPVWTSEYRGHQQMIGLRPGALKGCVRIQGLGVESLLVES